MGRGRGSISSTNSPFYHRSESNGFFKGPRRVFCFCILGVLSPTILMSIPLLMRFVFYGGEAMYHLNPSDMRLLDEKTSTTWCEGETIKINTTFTLYVTDGVPPIIKSPEPMAIRKTLIVPDDHKEYWGFYLLKGSTFSISTCARFKGGTLLVVKGRQHLEHCAYIGNEDSNGDSDEFSDSMSHEKTQNGVGVSNGTYSPPVGRPASKRKGLQTPVILTSSEEMSVILAKIRSFVKSRPNGYKKLRKSLAKWMLLDNNSTEKYDLSGVQGAIDKLVRNSSISIYNDLDIRNVLKSGNTSSEAHPHKIRHAKSKLQSLENGDFGIIRRRRHASDAEVRRMTESGEDGAFEDMRDEEVSLNPGNNSQNSEERGKTHHIHNKSEDSIWIKHSLHIGVLNSSTGNDGSDSESESSFSSSEEALARCEGKLGIFYLKPTEECGAYDDDSFIPLIFNATVNASGYYYFIFGSENEKRDNIIEAVFELEKYEYDLGYPLENCTNVNECHVDFQFGSDQKLVVSIPQPPANQNEKWDEYFLAVTECKPRTNLYLVFVLCVPLMILLCAFQ